MSYTRIDSFDITFADSSARTELKVFEQRRHANGAPTQKGVGEKRLYCGSDEMKLNEFFGFSPENTTQRFFLLKDDLIRYYKAIAKEYKKPTNTYSNAKELKKIYLEYGQKIENLKSELLELEFSYFYDLQNRYYIHIPKKNPKKKEYYAIWDYIRDICLPRVSRLLFMKLMDHDGNTSFYIKPYYGTQYSASSTLDSNVKPRSGQAKYRESVFEKYQKCVVTGVSNPKILVACHILPFAECIGDLAYLRYSCHNGLIMTPTMHKLFDLGYLTFDESDGKLIFSDFLFNEDRLKLHLDENSYIDVRDQELRKCLLWHNDNIFLKASKMLNLI